MFHNSRITETCPVTHWRVTVEDSDHEVLQSLEAEVVCVREGLIEK